MRHDGRGGCLARYLSNCRYDDGRVVGLYTSLVLCLEFSFHSSTRPVFHCVWLRSRA